MAERGSIEDNKNSKNEVPIDNDTLLNLTLLNLKMLTEIRENDKLYVDDRLLKLDHPTILQGVKRWYKNHSRLETMEFLENIVKNINIIFDSVEENDDNNNNEYDDILQRLSVEISGAAKGINNLKLTYKNDVFVKSKLDMIIDKLKTSLDRINKSMKIH